MNHLKFLFYTFLIHSFVSFASASTLEAINNSVDFTFESLTLPQNERMGLLGANYLIRSVNEIDFGLGLYSAVTGHRGGFFTGGSHIGIQKILFSNFFSGGELFAGGGGGGSAPQGGGLMLRGALFSGLKYHNHRFRIGYSYITFPNGNIDSYQMMIGYDYYFKTHYSPGWEINTYEFTENDLHAENWQMQNRNFSLQTSFYFPFDNNEGVSGKHLTKRMDVIGIRYQSQYNENIWLDIETSGALGGGIDGYAQIFSGFSYKYRIFLNSYLSTGLMVGAAGGGDVFTGGGSVVKTYIGIDNALFRKWYLFTHLGFITSPDGKFNAYLINFNIVNSYISLSPSGNAPVFSSKNNLTFKKVRIRPGVESYLKHRSHSRKSLDVTNSPVNSVHLKFDIFTTEKLFLTGQAVGAFDGNAGGYAAGLIGIGYQISSFVNIELTPGAAGGGGINVGSGKVVQSQVNISLPLSHTWQMEIGGGYIFAMDGELASWVASIGLGYQFKIPLIE